MSQHYHAHIYFDRASQGFAEELFKRVGLLFDPSEVKAACFRDHPVGPHPLPMFELNFHEEMKEEVVQWLERERRGLGVLVHEDTGQDERDHLENLLWLGDRLPIDFKFFEKIKTHPELKIHP